MFASLFWCRSGGAGMVGIDDENDQVT